jgi:hypothetical protein
MFAPGAPLSHHSYLRPAVLELLASIELDAAPADRVLLDAITTTECAQRGRSRNEQAGGDVAAQRPVELRVVAAVRAFTVLTHERKVLGKPGPRDPCLHERQDPAPRVLIKVLDDARAVAAHPIAVVARHASQSRFRHRSGFESADGSAPDVARATA